MVRMYVWCGVMCTCSANWYDTTRRRSARVRGCCCRIQTDRLRRPAAWQRTIQPEFVSALRSLAALHQITASLVSCLLCQQFANSAFRPSLVGKWVVIHVITWITGVGTINGRPGLRMAVWLQLKVRGRCSSDKQLVALYNCYSFTFSLLLLC